MANRSPQTQEKRRREREKQERQQKKKARRLERNAQKREARRNGEPPPGSAIEAIRDISDAPEPGPDGRPKEQP